MIALFAVSSACVALALDSLNNYANQVPVQDTEKVSLKACTHRDEFRTRYSPTFNAS